MAYIVMAQEALIFCSWTFLFLQLDIFVGEIELSYFDDPKLGLYTVTCLLVFFFFYILQKKVGARRRRTPRTRGRRFLKTRLTETFPMLPSDSI